MKGTSTQILCELHSTLCEMSDYVNAPDERHIKILAKPQAFARDLLSLCADLKNALEFEKKAKKNLKGGV